MGKTSEEAAPGRRKDRGKKWWDQKKTNNLTSKKIAKPLQASKNNRNAKRPVSKLTLNKGGFQTKIGSVLETSENSVNHEQKDKTIEEQNIIPNQAMLKLPKKKNAVPYYLQYNGTPLYPMKDDQTHMSKRYVLFIGNLPYDITKEQLEEHFRKTRGVKSIRIPKDKGSDICRGYAYVEFKDRISNGIALRLHHTTLGGRKINVEFTSIGDNNKERKEKLKLKNVSLSKLKLPIPPSSKT